MRVLYLTLLVIVAGMAISFTLIKIDHFSPKIGVCSSLSNIGMIGDAGYDYLEAGVGELLMPNEPETKFQLKKALLKDAKINVYACNGFIPATLKSVGPDADHDSIVRYATIAFRRAQELGIKTIIFGSGSSRRIPDGFDMNKGREQFIALLKKISPIAKEYDVVISMEVLNTKETNLINRISEGVDVAKAVNHPNCMVLADIFHMTREGEGADEILKAKGFLYHCHIAENKDRTAPGMAGDDFRPFFRALKKIGYKGHISIEGGFGSDMKSQLPLSLIEMKKQIAEVK